MRGREQKVVTSGADRIGLQSPGDLPAPSHMGSLRAGESASRLTRQSSTVSHAGEHIGARLDLLGGAVGVGEEEDEAVEAEASS